MRRFIAFARSLDDLVKGAAISGVSAWQRSDGSIEQEMELFQQAADAARCGERILAQSRGPDRKLLGTSTLKWNGVPTSALPLLRSLDSLSA